MPSHQQNLDAVRAAAVRARMAKGAVEATNNYLDPDLPNILLALYRRIDGGAHPVFVGEDGWFYNGKTQRREECWNLRVPLSGQPESTVAYLANLLK